MAIALRLDFLKDGKTASWLALLSHRIPANAVPGLTPLNLRLKRKIPKPILDGQIKVGPGPLCHVTNASRGARAAPVGPAAAPPASWSQRQPGSLARGGCDLRSRPVQSLLGPVYAVEWVGKWSPAPVRPAVCKAQHILNIAFSNQPLGLNRCR